MDFGFRALVGLRAFSGPRFNVGVIDSHSFFVIMLMAYNPKPSNASPATSRGNVVWRLPPADQARVQSAETKPGFRGATGHGA